MARSPEDEEGLGVGEVVESSSELSSEVVGLLEGPGVEEDLGEEPPPPLPLPPELSIEAKFLIANLSFVESQHAWPPDNSGRFASQQ